MFLYGFVGAGTNRGVKVIQWFCFEFCHTASILWNEHMFLFTITNGSTAPLVKVQTIHDTIFINWALKNIVNKHQRLWQDMHIDNWLDFIFTIADLKKFGEFPASLLLSTLCSGRLCLGPLSLILNF